MIQDTKTKKLKLPDKKEIELQILRGQIQQEKETFNRYVKVLVKHAFTDIGICSGTVYFEDLWRNELKNTINLIDDAKISDRDKKRLKHELFFSSDIWAVHSEKENLEADLKYWERMVAQTKQLLSMLSDEKKTEIITESIKQHNLWSDQFSNNSKIFDEIARLTKKK